MKQLQTEQFNIPLHVSRVAQILASAGYDVYLVGGCVRDVIMGREPHDWDLTTNASPEEIVRIYTEVGKRVVYENSFGTVAIVDEELPLDSTLRTIEITPYRTESGYSDHRHPDEVRFTPSLTEDLLRRDFTMNAIALSFATGEIIDPYNGVDDIQKKIIRAVGNVEEGFTEDALRVFRAIRFSAQLEFILDKETESAIIVCAHLLDHVSRERVRDEFIKLMMTRNPFIGLELLRTTGLLQYVSPELLECVGIDQSRNHIYDVWEHCIRAGDNAAKENWSLHVRIAAVFHDVGKPRTRRWEDAQKIFTFYGHEVVGARMVEKFLSRLKFPKDMSETIVKLVRYHMFFSDTEKISLSAVRRMIRNVGTEHIWDLMQVRRSDRIGMGRAKADPYRLRMYESMIEEALRDPIDVSMLAVDGTVLMTELGVKPGREIGWILHILLEEVLEDPLRNTKEILLERSRELLALDRETLAQLGQQGKETQKEADANAVKHLRHKHGVRIKEWGRLQLLSVSS